MSLLPIACVAGALLQIADYASTRLAVECGKATESNPLLQRLMLAYGFRAALIASKLAAVALFAYLYAAGVDWRVVAGLDLLYLVVVFNNYRIARS